MKTKIGIAALLAVAVLFLAGCQSSKVASGAGNAPLLTEGEVRDIALKDAGLSLNSVDNLHIEKEIDDGITKYDVNFRQGDYEYDYEIDAATGKIIGFDKDLETVTDNPAPADPPATDPVTTEPAATTTPATTKAAAAKTISKSKAQSIALDHAKLKESEVTGLRVSLDKDDGRTYYEVDFRKGNVEYDYEIDAVTGKVIEWDKDIDDD